MSVYKEALYCIKEIEQNSKQIYPDAADYGAPVKKGDPVWNAAKQLVEWYGVEGTKKVIKYATGTTVKQMVEFMPNEHESPAYMKVKVVYVTTRGAKDMDGYIYVEPS